MSSYSTAALQKGFSPVKCGPLNSYGRRWHSLPRRLSLPVRTPMDGLELGQLASMVIRLACSKWRMLPEKVTCARMCIPDQGCYAMALIWLMIHESSYLDSTLLVNPSLRQSIGCVIQVVGRHQRLGKNLFKPKFSTVMPSHSTLDPDSHLGHPR